MSRDVPIEIWRGANDPAVIWGFDSAPGVPADLAGSNFDLLVAWPVPPSGGPGGGTAAGTIAHTSSAEDGGDGVLTIDLSSGEVTWPITVAESEVIPRGARVVYELFRTIAGRRRLWCGGAITVRSYRP